MLHPRRFRSPKVTQISRKKSKTVLIKKNRSKKKNNKKKLKKKTKKPKTRLNRSQSKRCQFRN